MHSIAVFKTDFKKPEFDNVTVRIEKRCREFQLQITNFEGPLRDVSVGPGIETMGSYVNASNTAILTYRLKDDAKTEKIKIQLATKPIEIELTTVRPRPYSVQKLKVTWC